MTLFLMVAKRERCTQDGGEMRWEMMMNGNGGRNKGWVVRERMRNGVKWTTREIRNDKGRDGETKDIGEMVVEEMEVEEVQEVEGGVCGGGRSGGGRSGEVGVEEVEVEEVAGLRKWRLEEKVEEVKAVEEMEGWKKWRMEEIRMEERLMEMVHKI